MNHPARGNIKNRRYISDINCYANTRELSRIIFILKASKTPLTYTEIYNSKIVQISHLADALNWLVNHKLITLSKSNLLIKKNIKTYSIQKKAGGKI